MSSSKGITQQYSLEIKDIFPDEENDFKHHLEGIGKDFLTTACIFLLSFKNYDSEFSDYKKLFGIWFSDPNIGADLIERISQFEQKSKLPVSIINPYTTLKLLEFCFKELPEKSVVNDAEFEIGLIKAYLSLNQETNLRDKKIGESVQNFDNVYKLSALTLTQSFSYSDIVNYYLEEVLITQMIKAYLLLQFLAENAKTKRLLVDFLSYYGLSNWKEFLKSYFPLSLSFLKKEKEAHIDITVTQNDKYDLTCSFMDKLMLTDDDEFKYRDFVTLRSKPFYKIADGQYRIIYMLFAVEKLFQGMYFSLSAINKSLSKQHKVAEDDDFRSFYCDHFSEQFLLYQILQRCFPKKFVKHSGEDLKKFGVSGGSDYYVRFKNKLFLFESKDVLIKTDVKHSNDYRLIEKELKKKFYFDEETEKTKRKAILQLLNNIQAILSSNYTFDGVNSDHVQIYPILVVHNRMFNTAGLNRILLNWFNEELEKLAKEEGFNVKNVRGLVVINIDILILIQDYLQNRSLKLEEIIEEYLYYAELQKLGTFKTRKDEELYVQRSLRPFEYFVYEIIDKKGYKEMPKMLMEHAATLFD